MRFKNIIILNFFITLIIFSTQIQGVDCKKCTASHCSDYFLGIECAEGCAPGTIKQCLNDWPGFCQGACNRIHCATKAYKEMCIKHCGGRSAEKIKNCVSTEEIGSFLAIIQLISAEEKKDAKISQQIKNYKRSKNYNNIENINIKAHIISGCDNYCSKEACKEAKTKQACLQWCPISAVTECKSSK